MTSPSTSNPPTPPQTQTANKRKTHPNAATTLTQHTLRSPSWTYLHLQLQQPSAPNPNPTVDALTARQHLTSALSQFLGLTGTAIPIDILKLENSDVWIRVPFDDGAAVEAAVGGWVGVGGSVGWRVVGKDEWLGRLVGGDGRDLFGD